MVRLCVKEEEMEGKKTNKQTKTKKGWERRGVEEEEEGREEE